MYLLLLTFQEFRTYNLFRFLFVAVKYTLLYIGTCKKKYENLSYAFFNTLTPIQVVNKLPYWKQDAYGLLDQSLPILYALGACPSKDYLYTDLF